MLERWFGLDDPYERPTPQLSTRDWVVALGFLLFTVLTLELIRSFAFWPDPRPRWIEYLALVTGTLPLAWRRRYPLTVAAYLATHFVVAGTLVPELGYQVGMQIGYFFAVFCGVAWPCCSTLRSRRSRSGSDHGCTARACCR